jgi:hypothetical protein
LDSYVEANGIAPDLLKIDTEGNELNVLRGALGTIKRHAPVIVLESGAGSDAMSGNPDNDASIGRLLQGLGYQQFALDTNNKYFLHSRSTLLQHHRALSVFARMLSFEDIEIALAASGLPPNIGEVTGEFHIILDFTEMITLNKREAFVMPFSRRLSAHNQDDSAEPRPNRVFLSGGVMVSLYNATQSAATHQGAACSMTIRTADVTISALLVPSISPAGHRAATRVLRGIRAAVCATHP